MIRRSAQSVRPSNLAIPMWIGVVIAWPGIAQPAEPITRPNVLFVAVDDLKPVLGCYGDTTVQTPNIDRLAQQGTVFLNAHCQQAVCGPSRASLLTGLRPDHTGVWDLKTKIRDVNPNIITLPQYFKQHGYETVGLGKVFDFGTVDSGEQSDAISWSRPYVNPQLNDDLAFGHYDPEFVEYCRMRISAEDKVKKRWVELCKAVGGIPPTEGSADVPDATYNEGIYAQSAVELIEELACSNKPFFLAVGFQKPHLPFIAPKKYWDLYDRNGFQANTLQSATVGAPSFTYQDSWELRNGTYSGIPKEGDIPISTQRELLHGYHACVSYVDKQVGRLIYALEASGVAENTIVVLWGDHGYHLGDHGMWCKHTEYEQATRSPLILSVPQIRSQAVESPSPVELLDIFPTLCEAAGLPVPEQLEGVSLLPILQDPDTLIKPAAVSQYQRFDESGPMMGYAYRTKRYRYIEWVSKSFREQEHSGPIVAREFYDYQADPFEMLNLIDDPAYRNAVADLESIARELDLSGAQYEDSTIKYGP